MAANRGEIAVRIMRAGTELGCRTVGIFSHEDRYQQHRSKADQAFQVGLGKSPVGAYLDISSIVDVAAANGVQAIHPGYGFLSENTHFAKVCSTKNMTLFNVAFIHKSPSTYIRYLLSCHCNFWL